MKFLGGITAAVLMLSLTLTSCEDTQTTAVAKDSSSPSDAPTPEVAKDAKYGSVADLRDAAVEAGYTCRNWHQDNAVKLAAESGSCDDDSVLSTYASDTDLQSQLDIDKEMDAMLVDAGIDTTPTLVGPNWLIKAPQAGELRDALGGVLVGAKAGDAS